MSRISIAMALLLSSAACGPAARSAPEERAETGAAALRSAARPESVTGGEHHYNVWPMGDPAKDPANVQWAIDHVLPGGVVELKATEKLTGVPQAFEFGDGGSVAVTRSVSIRGEVDDAGAALATIHGGYKPITCDDPSVVLEIETLRFDGARRVAIHVQRSAGAAITGNVIRNVMPTKAIGYPNPLQFSATAPRAYDPLPYWSASGIEMGSLLCLHPDPQPPNACLDDVNELGSVDISGNFIDVGLYNGEGELLDPTVVYPNAAPDGTPLEDTSFSGILLVDARVAATIAGNTILNTTRRAIHPLDTFGSTEIVGNTVVMAPFSSAAPGQPSSGGSGKRNFGIFPLNGHRNVDAATSATRAVHHVIGNTIVLAADAGVDGPHGNAIIGINAHHDMVVSDNTIIYEAGARNAIAMVGNNSSVWLARPYATRIDHNTIDASLHPLATSSAPAHILLYYANSSTVDSNTYLGPLPRFVILGLNTGVTDSIPNTVVDAYCGTAEISFQNLASCSIP